MDGAIVVDPAVDDPFIAACDRAGVPVVTIGRRVPADSSVPAHAWVVDNDFPAATRRVLDHLDERGSRSPALFAAEPIDSFQRDSIDAYEDWCAKRGRRARVVVADAPHPLDAATAAERLFDGDDSPDGVYATIDTLARAVMDRATSAGIPMPGGLKIATCSNGELTRTAVPQLTTLDEHPDRLGEAAVELLVAVIEDPASAPDHVEVGTDLLIRESTA
jgi:DNA-binding LacI/PurR family transcriptional regulator